MRPVVGPDGSLRMTMACLARPSRLAVSVPAFTPVGSEDRFGLGLSNEPITLVADPTVQRAGDGVTAEGPIPDNFGMLLRDAGQVMAVYGYQKTGPFVAPEGARRFVRGGV